MLTANTLFPVGRLCATPAAVDLLRKQEPTGIMAGDEWLDACVVYLMDRHTAGDWTEMCAADALANVNALRNGGRIFSSYRVGETDKVWIITEADRASTLILTPADY